MTDQSTVGCHGSYTLENAAKMVVNALRWSLSLVSRRLTRVITKVHHHLEAHTLGESDLSRGA